MSGHETAAHYIVTWFVPALAHTSRRCPLPGFDSLCISYDGGQYSVQAAVLGRKAPLYNHLVSGYWLTTCAADATCSP